MKEYGRLCWLGCVLCVPGLLLAIGCYNTPIATSEYDQGPAPLRMPSPETAGADCNCYEDSLTGGQVFTMYCSYCHNAPSLAERPFSNFQNVAAHMRVRANLTGKEYAKLMEFLARYPDQGVSRSAVAEEDDLQPADSGAASAAAESGRRSAGRSSARRHRRSQSWPAAAR